MIYSSERSHAIGGVGGRRNHEVDECTGGDCLRPSGIQRGLGFFASAEVTRSGPLRMVLKKPQLTAKTLQKLYTSWPP